MKPIPSQSHPLFDSMKMKETKESMKTTLNCLVANLGFDWTTMNF